MIAFFVVDLLIASMEVFHVLESIRIARHLHFCEGFSSIFLILK